MKSIDCEHLYQDGRHYDLQNKDFLDDVPFYLHKIKKYGEPVLELACGTGRVTIPLAEKGIQITGLDISEPMLSHAKRKAVAKRIDNGFTIEAKFGNYDESPFVSTSPKQLIVCHMHKSDFC